MIFAQFIIPGKTKVLEKYSRPSSVNLFMEQAVKNEIKKTSKKTAASLTLWAFIAIAICCGGLIVILLLISGGATGLLGALISNVYLGIFGFIVFISVLFWFLVKFLNVRSKKNERN